MPCIFTDSSNMPKGSRGNSQEEMEVEEALLNSSSSGAGSNPVTPNPYQNPAQGTSSQSSAQPLNTAQPLNSVQPLNSDNIYQISHIVAKSL